MKINKSLFICITLVTLHSSLLAQSRIDSMFKAANSPFLDYLINKQCAEKAADKSTNSGQRLIRIETTDNGKIIYKSLYTWGGNRSTVHTPYPFDVAAYSNRNPTQPMTDYPTGGKFLRDFKQKPDSAVEYRDPNDGFSTGLKLSQTIRNHYNTTDDLVMQHNHINYIYASPPQESQAYFTCTYNANGSLFSLEFFLDTSVSQTGAYKLHASMYCSYSNTGKLEKDSLYTNYSFEQLMVRKYLADLNGKDTAIVETHIDPSTGIIQFSGDRYVLNYYPNGLLKTSKRYDDNMGFLRDIDSLGYTGSYTYPTYHIRHQLSSVTNQMEPIDITHNILNSNGDIQTSILLTGNMDTTSRYTATYNSFFNPDFIILDTYHPTIGWQNGFRYDFYYDPFINSIAEKKKQIPLIIYPNPVASILTISTGIKKDAAIISIIDIQGRLIQQYFNIKDDIQLDLSKLSNGNYIVKYETAKVEGQAKIYKK